MYKWNPQKTEENNRVCVTGRPEGYSSSCKIESRQDQIDRKTGAKKNTA